MMVNKNKFITTFHYHMSSLPFSHCLADRQTCTSLMAIFHMNRDSQLLLDW